MEFIKKVFKYFQSKTTTTTNSSCDSPVGIAFDGWTWFAAVYETKQALNKKSFKAPQFLSGDACMAEGADFLRELVEKHGCEEVRRAAMRRILDPNAKEDYEYFLDGVETDEICTLSLKAAKADVEKTLGYAISKVVISIPCMFTTKQRETLIKAARNVGLVPIKLLHETDAIMLTYLNACPKSGKYMIYHMGETVAQAAIYKERDGIIKTIKAEGVGRNKEYCDIFKTQEMMTVPQQATKSRFRRIFFYGEDFELPEADSLRALLLANRGRMMQQFHQTAAYGAAIQAAQLGETTRKIITTSKFEDLLPSTLGIPSLSEKMSRMLTKGTTIPACILGYMSSLKHVANSAMMLDLYEGEWKHGTKNDLVKKVRMFELKKAPPGVPLLIVMVAIPGDGTIIIEVDEIGGEKQHVAANLDYTIGGENPQEIVINEPVTQQDIETDDQYDIYARKRNDLWRFACKVIYLFEELNLPDCCKALYTRCVEYDQVLETITFESKTWDRDLTRMKDGLSLYLMSKEVDQALSDCITKNMSLLRTYYLKRLTDDTYY